MKNKSILLMLVCCFFAQVKAQKQPVDYVNTIIGATTAADGKMFAYDEHRRVSVRRERLPPVQPLLSVWYN